MAVKAKQLKKRDGGDASEVNSVCEFRQLPANFGE